MSMLNQRLVVLTTKAQFDALKKLNKETGAPVGEIVRRAIEAYLKKEGK